MYRLAKINEIRERLSCGGVSIGSWMQIPHPSIAEIMGSAGYDWVAVDMEHGAICHAQLPDLFRAFELGGTLPLVRVSEGTAKDCKQALDAGAGGIIVPMVEDSKQLTAVRDACRWPPAGVRGVGFSRANLFGKRFQAYREESQAPLLIAMIEHSRAVDNLEEILKVDGLDAILIGPYDLSASIGKNGQFNDPAFCELVEKIRSKSLSIGIPLGMHVVEPSKEKLSQVLSDGFRFVAYSIDAVMLNSVVSHGLS